MYTLRFSNILATRVWKISEKSLFPISQVPCDQPVSYGLFLMTSFHLAGERSPVGPILALGIRGTLARPIWLDELGPMDPTLARRTDPNSLIALFGGRINDLHCRPVCYIVERLREVELSSHLATT